MVGGSTLETKTLVLGEMDRMTVDVAATGWAAAHQFLIWISRPQVRTPTDAPACTNVPGTEVGSRAPGAAPPTVVNKLVTVPDTIPSSPG